MLEIHVRQLKGIPQTLYIGFVLNVVFNEYK